MKCLDQLMTEHRTIERVLGVLGAASRNLRDATNVPGADIDAMIEFLRGYADRLHHGKEEDILFRWMADRGFPEHGGPVYVMRAEHEEGRAFIHDMLTTARSGITGGSVERFCRTADGYIQLLAQHIRKEDNILYPMAAARMTEEDDRDLLRRFDEAGAREPGAADRFERMAENLADRYGSIPILSLLGNGGGCGSVLPGGIRPPAGPIDV